MAAPTIASVTKVTGTSESVTVTGTNLSSVTAVLQYDDSGTWTTVDADESEESTATSLVLEFGDGFDPSEGWNAKWRVSVSNGTDDPAVSVFQDVAYPVEFRDWDGKVLKSYMPEKGTQVVPPSDPSRPRLEFVGWDVSLGVVKGPFVANATYGRAAEPLAEFADAVSLGRMLSEAVERQS